MNDLYFGKKRRIMEPFLLFRGKGEFFDLSTEPPRGEGYPFGEESVNPSGYRITNRCIACGIWLKACPVGMITEGETGSTAAAAWNAAPVWSSARKIRYNPPRGCRWEKRKTRGFQHLKGSIFKGPSGGKKKS